MSLRRALVPTVAHRLPLASSSDFSSSSGWPEGLRSSCVLCGRRWFSPRALPRRSAGRSSEIKSEDEPEAPTKGASEHGAKLPIGAAAAIALQMIPQLRLPADIDAAIKRVAKGRTSGHLRRVAEDLKERLRSKTRTIARGGAMDGRALEAWQGPEQQTVRQATAWSRLREAEAAAADRLFELGADPETLTGLIDPVMWKQAAATEFESRKRQFRESTIRYGAEQVAAYAVQRMPGCYSALRRVFSEVASRSSAFSPSSMLDFGAGPGAALWALMDTVAPGRLQNVTLVETVQAMVELGRDIESRRKRDLLQLQSRLAGTDARGVGVSEAHDAGPRIAVAGAGGVLTHVSAADFAASHAGRRGAGDAAGLAREGEATDVGLPEGVVGSVPESVAAAVRAGRQLMPDVLWTPTLPGVRDRRSGRSNRRAYDIVSASYVLAEIDDPKERKRLVKDLWDRTGDVLVLVEPGTPVGFTRIKEARELVLSLENHGGGPLPRPGFMVTVPELAHWEMTGRAGGTSDEGGASVGEGGARVGADKPVEGEGEAGGVGGGTEEGSAGVEEELPEWVRRLEGRDRERALDMLKSIDEEPDEEWDRFVAADIAKGAGSPTQDGTKAGARHVTGAHVVAPCPGDGECPMDGKALWCAFGQRFSRPALTQRTKGLTETKSPRSFQDEKFSFVVLRRGPRSEAAGGGAALIDDAPEGEESDQAVEVEGHGERGGEGDADGAAEVQGRGERGAEGPGWTSARRMRTGDKFLRHVRGGVDEASLEVARRDAGQWARIVLSPRRTGSNEVLTVCQREWPLEDIKEQRRAVAGEGNALPFRSRGGGAETGLVVREYMLTKGYLRRHSALAARFVREAFHGDLLPPHLLRGEGRLAVSSAEVGDLLAAVDRATRTES